ncbi:hypothetical protein sos41_07190 [Alphaproteobacteria bacterium SO-S41]|nr:hypothetical protein sos41_07190 [Alphaproteobacteria bacterium SO-S41]
MRALFLALAGFALLGPAPAGAQTRDPCAIVTSADVLKIFARLGLVISGGEAGITEDGREGDFVSCDRKLATPSGTMLLKIMYISDSGVADGHFNGWRSAREVYDHLLANARSSATVEAHPEIGPTAYYLDHRSGSQEREVIFLQDNAVVLIDSPNYGYVPKSVVLAAASVASGVTPHVPGSPSSSSKRRDAGGAEDFIKENETALLIAGGVAALVFLIVVIAVARRSQTPSAPALVTGLTDSAMENLESAKALFDQGAISKSEFERLKAKALGITSGPAKPLAAAGAFSDSGMEQLENAKALLDQGILSPSEYERLKAKILNG